MGGKRITKEKKQRILEFWICGNDKRLWVIAQLTRTNPVTVSRIVQYYYDGEIKFERGEFKILHSKIN